MLRAVTDPKGTCQKRVSINDELTWADRDMGYINSFSGASLDGNQIDVPFSLFLMQ